ncbi:hypothetical protein M3573_18865 [Bacillus safensis]|uniref:hypothetical protein n=1 Tax=Bacillus safensis TaxID=561879 RepID=UPI00203C000C|nr:hypothetical protein [Bacillus safensis]MCM3140340.1 hypothetical protein [Bacillus safensis]
MNLVEKMKVVKTGYDKWDIEIEGKAVARIEPFHRGKIKSLWVKDKHVCDIKDQKEACEKLLQFFIDTRKRIELIHKHNEELEFGCGVFRSSSYVCFSVLRERQRELENIMRNIKKYDYLGERNLNFKQN